MKRRSVRPFQVTSGQGYARERRVVDDSTMSDSAKMRRRLFAAHYVKTTNATEAARYAGFRHPSTKGLRLLHEPYTLGLIRDLLSEIENDAIVTQQEIMLMMKAEASNVEAGNQSARVTALAHLAKISGMLEAPAENSDGASRVMVVPAIGDSLSSWEGVAEGSQEELKRIARE